MTIFEKGIAIWFVALAAGGVWLYASSSNSQPKAATAQVQSEPQQPAVVQAEPTPQPPAVVQAQPTPQPPAVVKAEPDYFLRAKQAVTRILKDPDLAKFGNLFEGSGRSGKSAICGFINAKNGYGGYTGMTQFIYFINQDEAYIPPYLMNIAVAWNAECTDSQGRRRFE